jgi:hypothetical protein
MKTNRPDAKAHLNDGPNRENGWTGETVRATMPLDDLRAANIRLRTALQLLYLSCIYDDSERGTLRCQECLREWKQNEKSCHSSECPMIFAEYALHLEFTN